MYVNKELLIISKARIKKAAAESEAPPNACPSPAYKYPPHAGASIGAPGDYRVIFMRRAAPAGLGWVMTPAHEGLR